MDPGQRHRRNQAICSIAVYCLFSILAAAVGAEPPDSQTSQIHRVREAVCIQALLFDGAVEIRGRIKPEPGLPWSGRAELRSFPVAELARFLPPPADSLRGGSVSGDLTLSGSLDPAPGGILNIRVEGTLTADSLAWSRNEALGDTQEWVLSGTDLELRMKVEGDADDPTYSGSLDGESGWVEYLGRRIPISGVHVRIPDSTAFAPVIDLSAGTSIVSNAGTEYRVQFDVTGPASRARPRLSSSPALSRQDIESLLALGIPLSAFSDRHVGRYEGSYWSQQVFLFRAMEVAANRIVGVAESRARGLLGLDEVRVPTTQDLAGGRPEMEIAKRLGGRAMLSYTSPMWHSGAYRVRLDLRLTDHVSLESENDQTGDSGMDVRFKVRFR